MIEWHGGKPFGICADCGKPVRLNKPLFGDLHFCLTDCAIRGHHSGPFFNHRLVGPFWDRRNEYQCVDCHQVIDVPAGYKIKVVPS